MSLPTSNTHLIYRPEIDGLRAIAILLVILFHLFPDLMPGGYVGVDVFFVISGYLITSLIIQRHRQIQFSIVSFYKARICRLFPALLLVLASTILWGWFFFLPIDYSRLGRHLASTMGFFENFTLKRESGYFDADIKLKPLAHMWSLSIEEQFYLIFPLLVMGLRANHLSCRRMIIGLGFISLLISIWGVYAEPTAAYFLPWMRAWELLSGSTLFFLPKAQRVAPPFACTLLSLLGMVLIISSAFVLNGQTPFPGAYALPPVLGASLLIWVGAESDASRWILTNPLMTGIGLISYPLYLWHWPILSFLHHWPDQAANHFTISAAGILALLLSIATYHWVEKPLKPYRNGRILINTLIILALCIAVMGIVISRTKGFPMRYPELPRELTIDKPPFPKSWRFGECFLLDHQSFGDFKPACLPDIAPSTPFENKPQKRVLLWGDSYAAQLYPGIVAQWGHAATISQLTAMACAPIQGFSIREYPHCPEITQFVMDHLKTHGYDTVIIAGNWDGIFKHGHQDEFESTIKVLRESGVKNLVIYGPPPLWKKALPRILLEDYVKQKEKTLPTRIIDALDSRTKDTENWLQALTARYQIGYVSIYKTLCNPDGCLVRIDQNLTTMDDGHLTEIASIFVLSKVHELSGDPGPSQRAN